MILLNKECHFDITEKLNHTGELSAER